MTLKLHSMKTRSLLFVPIASLFFFSCVSTKKYQSLENQLKECNTSIAGVQSDLRACRDEKSELERQRAALEFGADIGREVQIFFALLHRVNRIAQRVTVGDVKGDGGRRELIEMVNA